MNIPNYSPLYQVTQQKSGTKWDLEQQEVFEQIKQEIVHAIALGPLWGGQDVRNALLQPGQGKMLEMCSLLQPGRLT